MFMIVGLHCFMIIPSVLCFASVELIVMNVPR